tara:strand:+ start:629 stop:745 length:117 start_codon:yes stop_codon:yes gene_type:complete
MMVLVELFMIMAKNILVSLKMEILMDMEKLHTVMAICI